MLRVFINSRVIMSYHSLTHKQSEFSPNSADFSDRRLQTRRSVLSRRYAATIFRAACAGNSDKSIVDRLSDTRSRRILFEDKKDLPIA
jgi:hypothetical protein